MRTLSTLKYFISLVLIGTSIGVFAQEKEEWTKLNIGIDMSKFVVPFIDNTRYGWEASGDFQLLKDMFVVGEIGSQTTKFDVDNYSYNSNGVYTRFGIDYNYMKHLDPESTDFLLIGARYGATAFYHEANNISITNEVWGKYSGGSLERKTLAASWVEITTGMRAHLFNNFYLGWNVRFKIKLLFQNDPNLQPYHVPGYGRGFGNSAVGLNYSLYYKIPIYKKKTAPIEE